MITKTFFFHAKHLQNLHTQDIKITQVKTPKLRSLAITIYRYCNFDLGVTIAKIAQNMLVKTRK